MGLLYYKKFKIYLPSNAYAYKLKSTTKPFPPNKRRWVLFFCKKTKLGGVSLHIKAPKQNHRSIN